MLFLLSPQRTTRRVRRKPHPAALSELREGEHGVIEAVDLASEEAQRVMELGFIPGARVTAARSAPGGDPRVYRVDGSEIALRRETAARMKLRRRVAAAD
jgi:ferrous iron transport protein A